MTVLFQSFYILNEVINKRECIHLMLVNANCKNKILFPIYT